ncbi:phospholipase A and acyltransferase 3-like [Ylistrum balloti]|uniref:phospholipase A and acyltransferase 3-like n=1 Tax=Ylistrum balloti TaxID=509963 RepID=UPI002905F032|nr:phospholipase A and acyltransferase 3-like [Ylistrum balloti]
MSLSLSHRGNDLSYYEKKHNETVLEELEVGDMVEFPRDFFSHWGVYIGDEKIVHLTGDESDNDPHAGESFFSISGVRCDKAWVKVENFLDVAQGCLAKKNNDKDRSQVAAGNYPRPSDEIMRTAYAMRGQAEYNVFFDNCEHFASYLRYGQKCSDQANMALGAIVLGGAAVVIGGLIGSLFPRKK